MHQDFIEQYPDLLSQEACDGIIERMDHIIDHSISPYKTKNNTADSRVDAACFAEHDYPEAHDLVNIAVGKAIEQYVEKYSIIDFNKHRIVMPYSSWTVKLQRTPQNGGYHKWHVENSGHYKYNNRILAWTLYLSTHEGEAETEFLMQGKRIYPVAGTVAIWPACWTHVHRGNPPYIKNKYIATGWFATNGQD